MFFPALSPLPTHQTPATSYYTGYCKQAQQLQLINPAISLQPNSGRRLAVTRFPDFTSKTDANLFAVAQRIAAQDVLRTEGKPARDFSLI